MLLAITTISVCLAAVLNSLHDGVSTLNSALEGGRRIERGIS